MTHFNVIVLIYLFHFRHNHPFFVHLFFPEKTNPFKNNLDLNLVGTFQMYIDVNNMMVPLIMKTKTFVTHPSCFCGLSFLSCVSPGPSLLHRLGGRLGRPRGGTRHYQLQALTLADENR